MPIVKVFIEGKVVYAGLDTMSTKTYIARGLVHRLRLPAVRTVYRLRRLNYVEENVESALVSFSMCTEGGAVMIRMHWWLIVFLVACRQSMSVAYLTWRISKIGCVIPKLTSSC